MNVFKRIIGLFLVIGGLFFLVVGLLPITYEGIQQTLTTLDEYPSPISVTALIPIVLGELLGLLPILLCLVVIWKGYQWLIPKASEVSPEEQSVTSTSTLTEEPQRTAIQTPSVEKMISKRDELNFYELAWEELEDNKFDKVTWAMAYAESDGDEAKTRAAYLRERVQSLKREQQDEAHIIREEEQSLSESEKPEDVEDKQEQQDKTHEVEEEQPVAPIPAEEVQQPATQVSSVESGKEFSMQSVSPQRSSVQVSESEKKVMEIVPVFIVILIVFFVVIMLFIHIFSSS